MSRILTMQLRPTRSYKAPSVGNLFHNSGLARAMYWLQGLKKEDDWIENIQINSTRQAVDLWRFWEEEARNLVINNLNKNPRKDQVLIEEGLMIIGTDLEKDKEAQKTYVKIFNEFKNWFEKTYDTKVYYYILHNHEGHETEKGIKQNLHIHFFFRNVTSKGYSVRKQIKKMDLSNFQTKIYEIGKKYINNLKRAKNYFDKGEKAPRHKSHRQYRAEKQKEQTKKFILTVSYLKEQLSYLRKQLINTNNQLQELEQEKLFTQEDYRKISNLKKQLNASNVEEIAKKFEELKKEFEEKIEKKEKDLKAKIKNKDLTIEKLTAKLEEYRLKVYSKYRYQDTNEPISYQELSKLYTKELKKTLQDKKNLSDKINDLEEQNQQLNKRLQGLEKENKELKEKLEFINKKITLTEAKIIYNDKDFFEKKVEFDVFKLLHKDYYEFLSTLKEQEKIKDVEIVTDKFNLVKKITIETETGTIEDNLQGEISIKSLNIEEDIKIAINIALAKGWKLEEIEPIGDDEFKNLVYQEIEKRLKEKNNKYFELKQSKDFSYKPKPKWKF